MSGIANAGARRRGAREGGGGGRGAEVRGLQRLQPVRHQLPAHHDVDAPRLRRLPLDDGLAPVEFGGAFQPVPWLPEVSISGGRRRWEKLVGGDGLVGFPTSCKVLRSPPTNFPHLLLPTFSPSSYNFANLILPAFALLGMDTWYGHLVWTLSAAMARAATPSCQGRRRTLPGCKVLRGRGGSNEVFSGVAKFVDVMPNVARRCKKMVG